MAGVTGAPWSIPYPTGTDRVADGDNAIQAVADRVTALFNQNIVRAPVPQTQVTTLTGWTGQVSYFARSGVCMVWYAASKTSWAGYERIANLPAPFTPYLTLYSFGYRVNSGAPQLMALQTDGGLMTITGASDEGGINGFCTFLYGNTNATLADALRDRLADEESPTPLPGETPQPKESDE